MQPIVNDFFCGCGGMGVGFLNAGYKIAGAWDFDKYAVQSYDHNVGHHVKQADIKEMTWQDVPFAHVWAFGFPCQDLSVAGKQAGLLLKCQDCDSEKVHATITPDRIEKRQNGRRAKDDEDPMFTLTAQDLHGVIIQTEEDDENGVIVSEICTETGLLDPNGCGKTLRVGGGGVVDQEAQLPAHTVEHIGVTVTDYATKLQKFTDTANCLQARDSKGFGRQGMTAVIEISKEDENAKT